MVILLAMLLLSFASAGLGIAFGVRLGKDRVRDYVLLRIRTILNTEKMVDATSLLSDEQLRKGLIVNLEEMREEVKAL